MAQEAASAQTAPGWYEQDGGLRFWDGSAWTDNRAPAPRGATLTLVKSPAPFALECWAPGSSSCSLRRHRRTPSTCLSSSW